MKRMHRWLISFLLIITSFSVQAGSKEEEQKLQQAICDVFGKLTKQAGQFRDQGLSQQSTTDRLMKGMKLQDQQITKIIQNAITIAYQNQKTSPEQLQTIGRDRCLQTK